jgi:hypothetical protein
MALSGSYTYTVPNTRNYLALTVSWSATQSVPNNNSTVKTTITLNRKSYGAIYSSGSKAWTLTVNGSKTTGTASIAGGNNSNTTLATATTTVGHNADGTKTFGVTFSINFGGVSWGSTGATINNVSTGNHNFTLNTIPRASTFASITSVTLGQAVSVNIANHANFSHNVQALIGNTSLQGWTGLAGGANTLTFNSSAIASLTAALATATSVTVSWIMSTNSGSTQINPIAHGTSTVSLPAGELAPTAGTLSISEGNATAVKLFTAGKYVQGISQLKFTLSGSSAKHGATIKSSSISFEGASYASGTTSAKIQNSGNVVVTATVTDSRGQSANTSVTVAVTPYFTPSIMTAIAIRSNASGGFVSDGTYCTTSYSVTAATLPMLSGGNYPTISLDMQAQGASGWTQVKSIPYTAATATDTQVLGSGYDGTKAYNIRIIATDKVGGTNQVIITLDVAHVLMSWGKTQVGIGKVATQGTLDVLGDTYLEGGLHVSGAATLGATTMSSATVSGALSGDTLSVGGQALSPTIISQLNNVGKLLWSGVLYPQAGDTAVMSIPLSQTQNGWLIRWSYSNGSAIKNNYYNYTLLPKVAIESPSPSKNMIVTLSMPNVGTFFKRLWYNDTDISGEASNNQGTQAPHALMDAVFAF